MWFNIIPPFAIVAGGAAFGGYALWWAHWLVFGNTTFFDKMWYEILPTAFIITAGLGLPGWALYHIHNLSLGNHYRRTLIDRWDRQLYQRDFRLNGNPYNVIGLEGIPDGDKKE